MIHYNKVVDCIIVWCRLYLRGRSLCVIIIYHIWLLVNAKTLNWLLSVQGDKKEYFYGVIFVAIEQNKNLNDCKRH